MLIVTATDLPRLMACNGSRLMDGFKSSIVAEDEQRIEGDAAHWLIKNTYETKQAPIELVDRKAPNGFYIVPEMVDYIDEFLDADPHRVGMVEIETSFAGNGWHVSARADRLVYDAVNNILHVDDFKYGWGLVEVEQNWTLIAHALGWCIGNQVSPTKIVFRIFQPRPYHADGKVRSWEITYPQLLELYNRINATLSAPTDVLVTGSHCKNCPAFVNCPAARKAQMNAIDVSEIAFNDSLDDETLSFFLDQMERATKSLTTAYKAYSDLALHRVRIGKNIKNYSIDTELSALQWEDHVTPEIVHMITGRNDLTKQKLITPTQAKKAGVDETILTTLSSRKSKGFKLVRVDENKKAQKAFGSKT